MISLIRRAFAHAPSMSPWNNRDPIRAELFSVERLEEHARSLAAAQPVTPKAAKGHPLAGRLVDNEAVLLDAYRTIAKAISEERAITPAAEWLVDNYHLVERQIREIRSDLPPGYYRQLPKLADGPFAGYPRVFGVAWAFVAHTDSRFDPEMLGRYVRAYQEVQPLTIGELWAVAITLRIVLVENSQAAGRADRAQSHRARGSRRSRRPAAGRWRTRGRTGPVVLAGYRARTAPGRVRGPARAAAARSGSAGHAGATWLDERLAAQGTTADAVVRDEHQRQGAANVTVRNIITSMRLISDVDWTELFERVSLVDDVLAGASAFPEMDFPTRNLYRSAIEELARGSDRTELEIARRAVLATEQATYAGAGVVDGRAGRSGLSSSRGRSRRVRGGDRLSAAASHLAGRSSRAIGIGGYVSAVALPPRLSSPRRCSRSLPLGCWGMAEPARWPRCDSRHRRGRRAGQSRRDTAASAPRSCPLWSCATACPRICARSSRCRRC